MDTFVNRLLQQLSSINIDHISVCFTFRERKEMVRDLWTKKEMPSDYATEFSEYWKKRAADDPELAKRLIGLYLEHYSKSGDPTQSLDCSRHPESLDLERLARSPGPYVEKSIRRVIAQVTEDGDDLPRTAPPSLATQIATATGSLARWASNGLKIVSEEELLRRKAICAGCEFWDAEAFGGTGRCQKCGCSTWAKLQMASENCPIGKWKAV